MNGIASRPVTWLAFGGPALLWCMVYLTLAMMRAGLERWLISRLQRRCIGFRLTAPMWRSALGVRPAAVRFLATATAVLAGAAVPLAPTLQLWGRQVELLPIREATLLFIMAMEWLSEGLLACADPTVGPHVARGNPCTAFRTLVLDAAPIGLLLLSMAMTTGLLHPQGEGTLNLGTIVELQGRWGGMGWIGIWQPFGLLLWLACAAPHGLHPRGRATLAWQVQALNRALLASVLFLGGWQGPLVDQHGWLGLLYTVAKVGLVTVVWAWSAGTLVDHAWPNRGRWVTSLSLAAVNAMGTLLMMGLATLVAARP